jgi:hypothetical protein
MTKRDSKGKPRKPKRPSDPNQWAHQLVKESTEEKAPMEQKVTKSEVSRVMAVMGRKGGKLGGKRRAEGMTEDQRRDSASKAARARWGKN